MLIGAAPSHRQHRKYNLRRAVRRLIAQSRKVGDKADVPEQDRCSEIGANRENVPNKRRPELRPNRHDVRVGKQPIGDPWAARVQQRIHAGAHDREQRHGFGKSVDRVAPLLAHEEQDRGNQSSRMADTDPPNEVDDVEGPTGRNVIAPDSDSLVNEPTDRRHEQVHEDERNTDHDVPRLFVAPLIEDDVTDLRVDRRVSLFSFDQKLELWMVRSHRLGLDLRVNISNLAKIGYSRSSLDFAQHLVGSLVAAYLGNLALGISDVAERDRLGRTRLLAGRDNLAILRIATLLLGLDAHIVDALDT